jgi:hypothetical protein
MLISGQDSFRVDCDPFDARANGKVVLETAVGWASNNGVGST